MAYNIQKTSVYSDNLIYETNNERLVVPVNISLTKLKSQIEKLKILNKTQDVKTDEKAKEILTFIVGEDQIEKLIDFYNGDLQLLFVDTVPFITEVLFPKINDFSESSAKQTEYAKKKIYKMKHKKNKR